LSINKILILVNKGQNYAFFDMFLPWFLCVNAKEQEKVTQKAKKSFFSKKLFIVDIKPKKVYNIFCIKV